MMSKSTWLGKWRNSREQPLGLTWVNEIHSLGIFFSYNTDYVVQKNFTDKAKTFKRVLDLWSQRNLSLIGKITILKSLAFSLLTYQCCSINPPDKFVDEITSMAYNFLWSGKINKVKRKTIIADYGDGGLKMLDFRSFINAQKAMWVKRISKEGAASWKAYPIYILNKLIGLDSFKCNLNIDKNWHINGFYWSLIKNWAILNNKEITAMDVMDIRRQCIWLNKHIKINKQEIKWTTWINKKIILIHDIIDEQGKFLSPNELTERYNIRGQVLQYNSLKDSIPKEWREKLKTIKIPRDEIDTNEGLYIKIDKHVLPLRYVSNKQVYWKLIKTIQIPHVTKIKWETELEIHEEQWTNIFYNSFKIRDTKIRAFQYKLIMNLVPCNLYLYRIGKTDTYKCNYCANIDHISHYFYECIHTRSFWLSLQNWWNNLSGRNDILDKRAAIIGTAGKNITSDKLNAILQLARWYIYIEKLNLQSPFLYKFLIHLKYKLKTEKFIYLRNNKITKYENLWEDVENYLD
jgi:hypothetical protein